MKEFEARVFCRYKEKLRLRSMCITGNQIRLKKQNWAKLGS